MRPKAFRQGLGNKLFKVRGFAARRGYDLASGVGTVNGPAFVAELALMASHPAWTTRELRLRLALAKLPTYPNRPPGLRPPHRSRSRSRSRSGAAPSRPRAQRQQSAPHVA